MGKKIKVRYIKSNDYRVCFTTGVYGGINANGLINANFCVDRVVLPESETVELDENGKTIGPIITEKNGDSVREVQTGILMHIKTTKKVIDWLTKKVTEYESKQK